MRYIAILIICIFESQLAISQIQKRFWNWEVIDTAHIVCLYDYACYMPFKDANYMKHEDFILEIGSDVSKYYSSRRFICDSLYYTTASAREEYTKRTISVLKQTAKARNSSEEYNILNSAPGGSCIKIYKNNITDSIYVRDQLSGNNYVEYREPKITMNWELCDDTIYILGYLCHEAKCFWRGRNYRAWYSEDIPISDGPYKFCGLPGLIMRLEDQGAEYKWDIKGFEVSKRLIFLDKPFENSQYIQADRKTILKNEWKRRNKTQQKINADMMAIGRGDKVETDIPYDLIELDYK